MANIPSGYTELEYIETAGAQYINTGFKPNQNTRVTFSGKMKQAQTCFFFGCRTAQNRVNYSVLLSGSTLRSDYGESKEYFSKSYVGETVDIDKNKNICSLNSETKENTASTFQSQFPLFLFCSNDGGTAKYFGYFVFEHATVYDSENRVLDFVPCKNPSGEVGLYDLVSKSFFENSGTGSFVAGPEVISQSVNIYAKINGFWLPASSVQSKSNGSW